ncbi:MAG: PilZ domain-containing protein [Candidatus Omnitrophota bacterium]
MAEEGIFNGQEKRKYHREKIAIGLTYSVLSPSQGVGIIRDISEGGFRFLTDKQLVPGTIIKAKFELPRDNGTIPMETLAKIAWCRFTEEGYLIGVQVLT